MTSNGFTLADPNDRGMLDVVDFDTSVPVVVSSCVCG
jgi:60 kDa SS-A/Ro ribonucleoprotein